VGKSEKEETFSIFKLKRNEFIFVFSASVCVGVCACECECECVIALLFLLSSNHFECVGTPVADAAVVVVVVVAAVVVVVITQEIALHLMTAIFISFASFGCLLCENFHI